MLIVKFIIIQIRSVRSERRIAVSARSGQHLLARFIIIGSNRGADSVNSVAEKLARQFIVIYIINIIARFIEIFPRVGRKLYFLARIRVQFSYRRRNAYSGNGFGRIKIDIIAVGDYVSDFFVCKIAASYLRSVFKSVCRF